MKKILFIATGGTIASKKSKNGLKPQISPEELLSYIPNLKDICEIDTIQLLNLDSTNMEPRHWCEIVACIQAHYDAYDGFVVAHGTDTMAYTAAGLSYMIQNSKKPIVITGSQKPIDMDITDAKTNLLDSFIYASDEKSQGVSMVFDGKVIAGTRAKKMRSKSYNAFSSIDFPFLAVMQEGQIMRYIPMLPFEEDVKFYNKLNQNIFLLKLIPGISPDVLDMIFAKYDAIIVESFGVGGIPKSIQHTFYELCTKYPEKTIIMATQVAHEGSDMTVYEVGNEMKTVCSFLESYDMTLEAVIAKTMWMLANKDISRANQEDVFYKNINFDVIFGKNRTC